MTDFTIEKLTIPASIDAPDAAGFIEMTHVRNEVEADVVGSHMLAYEPAELLPNWQNPYEPQVCLVAKVDGRIVARGLYMPVSEEGANDAWLSVEVLPEFRCKGIGSALYEQLAGMCASEGRTVEQADLTGPGKYTRQHAPDVPTTTTGQFIPKMPTVPPTTAAIVTSV